MKATFFFDTVLLKDDNKDFWGITLTYEFIKDRYLKYFDEITISTREGKLPSQEGKYKGYKKTNGIGVVVSPITCYNSVTDALTKKKQIKKQVDGVVKESDLIIVRMPSVIGMFACESAKKYRKKYVIEMVACPFDGYSNHTKKSGKLLAPIMYLLNRKYINEAPKVLYVTNKFLQGRYPTKGEAIACSDVELPRFGKEALEKRLKRIENTNLKEGLKLATVASVELKYKGQEYVFKAMAKLQKEGKTVKYYLAGGGDASRLKKLAKKYGVQDNIIFLGALSHKEVFDLIDAIDIYVQPSLQEGLPRALIEAMSRACPSIGFSTGGIPELLEKDFVVKKRDYVSLYKIVNNISKEQMINQAKKNYEQSCQFEREKLDKKRDLFYRGN